MEVIPVSTGLLEFSRENDGAAKASVYRNKEDTQCLRNSNHDERHDSNPSRMGQHPMSPNLSPLRRLSQTISEACQEEGNHTAQSIQWTVVGIAQRTWRING